MSIVEAIVLAAGLFVVFGVAMRSRGEDCSAGCGDSAHRCAGCPYPENPSPEDAGASPGGEEWIRHV